MLTGLLAKFVIDSLSMDVTKRHHVEFIICTLLCIVFIIALYKLFKLRHKLLELRNNTQTSKQQIRKRPRYIQNHSSKCTSNYERVKRILIKTYNTIKTDKVAYIEIVCILINCLLFHTYYRMYHLIE